MLVSLQLRKYIDFFEELIHLTDQDWKDAEICQTKRTQMQSKLGKFRPVFARHYNKLKQEENTSGGPGFSTCFREVAEVFKLYRPTSASVRARVKAGLVEVTNSSVEVNKLSLESRNSSE